MCQKTQHDPQGCLTPLQRRALERRGFLRLAALGGGAFLLGSFAPRVAWAAGGTEALLLSCMDYRLVDKFAAFMNGMGLQGKYDHIVLAGASLTAITDKFPAWNATFWEHLGVAIDLHHIHKVILLDHRDCGAYKVAFEEDFAKDPTRESKIHAQALTAMKWQIQAKYPQLTVESYLMGLDGKADTIES